MLETPARVFILQVNSTFNYNYYNNYDRSNKRY